MSSNNESAFSLFWVFILSLVSCVSPDGNDLIYQPTGSNAPRAMLVNDNDDPIGSLATRAFTICLFAKIQGHDELTVVNLFSFSSRRAKEVQEIVMEIDYNGEQSNLLIHGEQTSFPSVPPMEEWTHICAAWESKTGNAFYYINAQQDSTTSKLQEGYELGDDGFSILGQAQDDYNAGFDAVTGVHGKLTEFNVWDRVLTLNEVRKSRNCQLNGNVVNWMKSKWALYDELKSGESENPCSDDRDDPVTPSAIQPTDQPSICECKNETLEAMNRKIDLLMTSKTQVETLVNEFKEKIESIERTDELNEQDIMALKHNSTQWEKNITGLQSLMADGHEKNMKEIERRFNLYDENITSLMKKSDVCAEDIGSIKLKFPKFEQDVESLKQISAENEQDINKLKQKKSVCEAEINDLRQKNLAYEKNLNDRFNLHEENITNLTTRIDACTQDIGTVKEIIPKYEQNIENLKKNSTAYELDINRLKQKNSAHELEIKGLKQNNLANEQEISVFKHVYYTQEKNIDSLKQQYSAFERKIEGLKPISRQELDQVRRNNEQIMSLLNALQKSLKPSNCLELQMMGNTKSGVYKIFPQPWYGVLQPFNVYCDMDTDGGGWTVIQRRGPYEPLTISFYRSWQDYKTGFGFLSGEFWLGNQYIHVLTQQDDVSLRIDLEAKEGESTFATYGIFIVGPEETSYKAFIQQFSGETALTPGDAFGYANTEGFVTYDKNDAFGCAKSYKGGWWYTKCGLSNLNGQYLKNPYYGSEIGINWISWKGKFVSMRKTEMKIRPIRK